MSTVDEKPLGSRWRRCLALLAATALAAACTIAAGRRYDIGPGKLHAHVAGSGSPTVVLDSGMGETMEAWTWVWPEVAEFTRVLRYDRAGIGRSDPLPGPRTSAEVDDDLERLLRRAGITDGLVLVGHSFGGLNVRLFAARHPDRVVGLVLVDPTPIDFPQREAELRDEAERRKLETTLSLTGAGARAEYDGVADSARQVAEAPLPPGLPVIVISSTRREASAPFREAWSAMQDELAQRVGAERHEVVPDSTHQIQFDRPDVIVDAIRELVERTRGSTDSRRPGDDS